MWKTLMGNNSNDNKKKLVCIRKRKNEEKTDDKVYRMNENKRTKGGGGGEKYEGEGKMLVSEKRMERYIWWEISKKCLGTLHIVMTFPL